MVVASEQNLLIGLFSKSIWAQSALKRDFSVNRCRAPSIDRVGMMILPVETPACQRLSSSHVRSLNHERVAISASYRSCSSDSHAAHCSRSFFAAKPALHLETT